MQSSIKKQLPEFSFDGQLVLENARCHSLANIVHHFPLLEELRLDDSVLLETLSRVRWALFCFRLQNICQPSTLCINNYNIRGGFHIEELGNFLKSSSPLIDFSLSDNNIYRMQDSLINIFIDCLAKCPNLKSLDLSSCRLGKDCMVHLAEQLNTPNKFKCLAELNISDN